MALCNWRRFWAWERAIRTRRATRQRWFGPVLEPLEERIMLDGDPPALVVGRTLSTYSVAGVQNSQVTITYTVYNQQADPMTGVLLDTTLASGVTFQSASALPDQSGQELRWSLGPLNGFDRVSIPLTVALPNPVPLQLDTGAQALAMLDARAVSTNTPAATLNPNPISANLLAATPDANTTDPFVQEKAAELRYDPQQIFNFLQTQIGYNSYTGSLRGARGTLWSSAGNSLDEASLGVALMRASGIAAQYAEGTLSSPLSQQLILSMFPASFQVVGFIPAGTQTADPANDPELLTETRDHFWFQFDNGSAMQNADPEFAGSTIGQTFTAATNTFTEVPDSRRHKVEVKLNAEIYSQLGAAFGLGDGLSTSTVLDQTFNTVDLVGKPLTIGNFVNTTAIPGLVFVSKTTTYSPFIQVGDEAALDAAQDEVIHGADFQEVQTNFPLGSQLLTGLFLDLIVMSPGAASQTFERTLVDRIGFAARQGLVAANVSVDPNGPPALTEVDTFTIHVATGRQDATVLPRLETAISTASQQVQAGTQSQSASPAAVVSFRNLVVAGTRASGVQFLGFSDQLSDQFALSSEVKAYSDTPRIVIASFRAKPAADPQNTTFALSIDLRSDPVRAIPFPGQSVSAVFGFNALRGMTENMVENGLFVPPPAPPPSGQPVQVALSTATIFQAAVDQGIGIVAIDANNLGLLDALSISVEAKARITQAAQNGLQVAVPAQSVSLNNAPAIAWYELNPQTGDIVGVTEDGGHQASIELIVGLTTIAVLIAAVLIVKQQEITGTLDAFFINSGYSLCLAERNLPQLFGDHNCTQDYKIKVRNTERELSNLPVALETFKDAITKAHPNLLDAPLASQLVGLNDPYLLPEASQGATVTAPAQLAPGSTSADLQAASVAVSGQLSASWMTQATSSLLVQSLTAGNATVRDANGNVVGAGTLALSSAARVPVSVSGSLTFNVNGQGSLSVYAPDLNLGVSANWDSYTVSVTGNATLRMTTDALSLNGSPLPAGTYTITATSANLAGSGPSTSPNFIGSVTVGVTNGVVQLGPASGTATVAGAALPPDNGFTLAGFAGNVTIQAGASADAVTLSGMATNVMCVSGNPTTLTATQNSPVTFVPVITTSLAGSYGVAVQAPPGWGVTIDPAGVVTLTVPAGTQGGTFPIHLVVQSQSNPDLIAAADVAVTVTPTQPGIAFTVQPDAQITVPFQGAQLPTAFRATLQNLGPAADTFNLTFSNSPAGFTLLTSASQLTIPAGQTGAIGIYLVPSGQVPAPGTQVSFTVTAASTTNPAITATQTVTFTVPEIHGVTLASNPTQVNTIPGVGVSATLTVTAVGNVPENVTLTGTGPAGLTISGLGPLSLAVGQSATETVTLTPASSTSLNSTLQATITATFGPSASPATQTLQLPVLVVVAGGPALANAAVAAQQIGNTDLANRFKDLTTALTNLVQDPSNSVFKSQALANIDSLVSQLNADAFLTGFTGGLTTARAALAGAVTAGDVQTAVVNLGTALTNLATTLTDLAAHGFTLFLASNTTTAQPGSPAIYNTILQNTGSQTTTYDFSVSGLPAGVTASFSSPTLTLQPGQQLTGGAGGVALSLTENSPALIPAAFTIVVTAEGAPEINQSVSGTLTVRSAFVQVVGVDVTPPFTNPGPAVDVTAHVLNAVNQQRQAQVSYTVTDANGNTVFTSTPVPLTLTVTSSLVTLDLGTFPTNGLPQGQYTVTVTVADTNGTPVPGATGQGALLLGTPVNASLTVNPTTLPPGNGTVTNTLTLTGQMSFSSPLTQDGQVQTTPTATTVALDGNLAYVAGTSGIDIVDISNPNSPTVVGTFGGNLIVQGGLTVVRQQGTELYVGTTTRTNANKFTLLVYSIANPTSPQLQSNTAINYEFMSEMLVSGNTILVPTGGVFFGFGGGIFSYFGSVLAIDVSNPASPQLVGVLFNNHGQPTGGDLDQTGGTLVNGQIAYAASTTASGSNPPNAVGQVLVVDYSNPANLQEVRAVPIPGTQIVEDIGIQGNRALVVGSTQVSTNVNSNPGNVTLTVLDITDPLNPQVLATTLVTNGTFPQPSAGVTKISALPLGNGQFAVSESLVNGQPVLLIVDPSDPTNIVVSYISVPALVNEMAISGNLLYTTSSNGLSIYTVGTLASVSVTASVQVPKNTGVSVVPGSFTFPPSQTISGANFDTLVWNRAFAFGDTSFTFTWKSAVNNLQPGETRPVTLGATVNFTNQGTPGTLTLPGTAVSSQHVLSLSPASQTVQPAAAATYTVTLTNPTSASVAYSLAVEGVPANWVNLPAAVTVRANGSTAVPLTLTSDSFAAVGSYGLVVTAAGNNGAQDSVQGTLILAGQPAVTPQVVARGVVAQLAPAQASAGQGDAANFTVQVTNTGSATDTFNLTLVGLPAAVGVALAPTTIPLPPGASNFRDVALRLSPPVGTAPGDYSFTITVTSTTSATVSATATGTLTVLADGVRVALAPAAAAPTSSFQITVTNTGQTTDTFNLALASPGALVANLGTTQVTLAPGASQMVPVTTGPVNFAFPGPLPLAAVATSQTNPAVRDQASAVLTIAATKGVTASFNPATQTLAAPGPAPFVLHINNTGNTEDAYTATIAGTTGPITASLIGLDGLPTQTIPIFRLPGLAAGALSLPTTWAGPGTGTVTVRLTSLSDASITATATATVMPVLAARYVAAGSGPGDGARVAVFDAASGQPLFNFAPFNPAFTGGVHVALADVNKDGFPDIICAAGPGGGPDVKIISGREGATLASFYAFDPHFTGGVNVAGGDVNGDGFADIICGAGAGGGPNVVVVSGKDGSVLASFFAFDPRFTGGVEVNASDLNGNGRAEIIAAAGGGGGPNVAVFAVQGPVVTPLASFFPFAMNFTGGVRVAAGDVNGDGLADLVCAAGAGGGPRVRVFDGRTYLPLAGPLGDTLAFDINFTGGVNMAVGDVNGDGFADIVCGADAGGGPNVVALSGKDGSPLVSFFPFDMNFAGGARVNVADVNGDGRDEIIASPGAGGGPKVAIYRLTGLAPDLLDSFFAFSPDFTAGINVAAG